LPPTPVAPWVVSRPLVCPGRLDVPGVDQLHVQASGFQQVEPDPPVVAGRFQGDLLDPSPARCAPSSRTAFVVASTSQTGSAAPRAGTDAAPACTPSRGFGTVNRADPFQDLLVLLVLYFLGFPHHRDLSSRKQQGWRDARGLVGNRNLTGVLESNSARPIKVKARRQTNGRAHNPRCDRRRRATRSDFHACATLLAYSVTCLRPPACWSWRPS